MTRFAESVQPHYEEIYAWCRAHEDVKPVSNEVIAFDMMLESFRDATACFVDIKNEVENDASETRTHGSEDSAAEASHPQP